MVLLWLYCLEYSCGNNNVHKELCNSLNWRYDRVPCSMIDTIQCFVFSVKGLILYHFMQWLDKQLFVPTCISSIDVNLVIINVQIFNIDGNFIIFFFYLYICIFVYSFYFFPFAWLLVPGTRSYFVVIFQALTPYMPMYCPEVYHPFYSLP